MKPLPFLAPCFLLAACSSSTTQVPTISTASTSDATLVASVPSLEVSFDGLTCEILGESPLKPGRHTFALRNASSEDAYLIAGRLYADKRWEDFLEWFDTHCGLPGSICDRTGEAPWISWLFETTEALDTAGNRHYEFDLDVAGDYLFIVSWLDGNSWPCGTYQVVASP
jgi:hypothetical protein